MGILGAKGYLVFSSTYLACCLHACKPSFSSSANFYPENKTCFEKAKERRKMCKVESCVGGGGGVEVFRLIRKQKGRKWESRIKLQHFRRIDGKMRKS